MLSTVIVGIISQRIRVRWVYLSNILIYLNGLCREQHENKNEKIRKRENAARGKVIAPIYRMLMFHMKISSTSFQIYLVCCFVTYFLSSIYLLSFRLRIDFFFSLYILGIFLWSLNTIFLFSLQFLIRMNWIARSIVSNVWCVYCM